MHVCFLDPLPRAAPALVRGSYPQLEPVSLGEETNDVDASVEAVVWSYTPVGEELLTRYPRLRYLHRLGYYRGAGNPHWARAAGIRVAVTPYVAGWTVSEHALALTLALTRQLVPSHQAVEAGVNPAGLAPQVVQGAGPTKNWAHIQGGGSLQGKAVGILGFGEIAAWFVRLLEPFGCEVGYLKRRPLSPTQEVFYGVRHAGLDELLSQSDVVVSFLPATPETRGLLDREALARMRMGAYLVNVGRGSTVDEDALAQALAAGRLAGAALDVFALEPLPPNSPLLQLSNVVLTPHNAGDSAADEPSGQAGWRQTFEVITDNLERIQNGYPIRYPMPSDFPAEENASTAHPKDVRR